MTQHRNIDIVLPCYNPPKNWHLRVQSSITQIRTLFKDFTVGLIIVNDGSSVLNHEEVEFLQNKVHNLKWINHPTNKGKGAALRTGVKESDAEIVVFTDIDFPYTTDSLASVMHLLTDEKADVVVGKREQKYYRQTPGQRKRVSKLLRWVNRNIFQLPVSDTQCGLKGFNKRGKEAFLETSVDRYLFDLEFLMIAAQKNKNLSVHAVSVDLREGVVFSTLNTWIYLTEMGNILRLVLKRILT